ncbi:MAG: hypothetical protein SPK28_03870 [Bacilli bacterium]|nr:hypothetical protein [Bacilli bacterium]
MSHFFGTDGIRGKAGEFLTYEFIKEVGYSISLFIKKNKLEKKVLIGYDTRESSEFIVYTLTSIFLYYGINVDNCGICSTPCISYLSKKYSLSLMVTASHNSFDDNGIKVFLNNGQKIPPTIKDEIEMNMFLEHEELYSSDFGKLHFRPSLIYDYQSNLMSHFPHFKYKGKLLVDCANGGILNIINVIKQYSLDLTLINNEPNGKNINLNCGVTNIHKFKSNNKYDICAFLDGDGDRIELIDEKGNVVDGDDILYILCNYYRKHGKVGNLILQETSNLALRKYLNDNNIPFYISPTGDSNVIREMNIHESNLGGEPCGHIIDKSYMPCSDGLYILLSILHILYNEQCTLSKLIEDFEHIDKVERTILNNNKKKINDDILTTLKSYINEMFQDNLNIVVRSSGTENAFRICVQSDSHIDNLKIADFIENYLTTLINEESI